MLKRIFKYLVIFAIFSLFLDGYVFFIGTQPHRIYEVVCVILLFVLIFFDKSFIRNIYILYKKTQFKYLVYFIMWLFISSAVLIVFGKTDILIYYRILIKLLIPLLIPYIIGMYCIPKFLSYRGLYKLLINISLFIYIFGIVCYLGQLANISIFTTIQDTVSNLHLVVYDTQDMFDSVSGTLRLRSVFHEPGTISKFIMCFLPLYYSIYDSNDKIYKELSYTFNKLIKLLVIILAWLCLILAKSPIMLVFCLIVTGGWIFYKNKRIIYIFLLTLIFIILINIAFQDEILQFVQGTFLNRIYRVLLALKSLNEIVMADYSLGYRVVGVVNNSLLSLKSFILGFGFDNSRFFIESQLLNSPITLPPEQIANMTYLQEPGTGIGSYQSCFSRLLSEAGFVGFAIYYYLIYLNIKIVYNIKYTDSNITKHFQKGLCLCYISLIIFSIYIPEVKTPYIPFLLGLASSYCMSQYFYIKVNKNE